MQQVDFEVEISPGADRRYPVTARAPGGDAATSMHLPLTLEELDHQLAVITDAVLASSAVVRRLPTSDELPVQRFGRRLFEALVTGDVHALYVTSAQRAREEGATLRLVLRVRPPELARLPWEFLYDPGRQDYLGLSLPLVRYPQVLAPRQPLQVAVPLRILGMVARPGDQDALEADDEQRRLRTALAGLERDGLVELAWVGGQTYGDLEDAMDHGPWHAFHFVGHGGYDRASDEGTIALANDQGRTDPVGADDLSRLLGDHFTLRLVVLNACDTGRGSALDAFSSTAAALVRRSIPAVVAMQFAISDPAAIRFAQTFYQNVAKRLPVDTSVMRARRTLRRAKRNTLEWGTPVPPMGASSTGRRRRYRRSRHRLANRAVRRARRRWRSCTTKRWPRIGPNTGTRLSSSYGRSSPTNPIIPEPRANWIWPAASSDSPPAADHRSPHRGPPAVRGRSVGGGAPGW
jgi:hypothetical protein